MQFMAIYRAIMPRIEFSILVSTGELKRTHSHWRIAMGLVSMLRSVRVRTIQYRLMHTSRKPRNGTHLRYIIKCSVRVAREITGMRENIISFDSNFIFTNKLRANTLGIIDDDIVTAGWLCLLNNTVDVCK